MIRQYSRGYTLVEVLVALVVLLAGIVGIIQLFPVSLEGNREAELRGAAASLAQLKADELRRDSDNFARVIDDIRGRTTPTDPVVWHLDDRLAYSYSGLSTFSPGDDPADPSDDPGVARIIVSLNPTFDPSARVLYELRFDR